MKLYLAPMEGLGDRPFRKAMATIGGFDEACTEFLRVPKNAHVPSLAKKYNPHETTPIPLVAQVMGYDLDLVPRMCQELERRGAPRIDLNCGCPSNTVTGRGAGSSLLKEPEHLYHLLKAMVEAVKIPVTAKLRAGFLDTSRFDENCLAVQEAGVSFMALHPRTKLEGYKPPAHWSLIARAKQLLKIPVIGNGDILTVADAERMIAETGCDGLMIGRGAVQNPWIFQELRAHWAGTCSPRNAAGLNLWLDTYYHELHDLKPKTQVNKLKQITNFLLYDSLDKKKELLRNRELTASAYLEKLRDLLLEKNGTITYK